MFSRSAILLSDHLLLLCFDLHLNVAGQDRHLLDLLGPGLVASVQLLDLLPRDTILVLSFLQLGSVLGRRRMLSTSSPLHHLTDLQSTSKTRVDWGGMSGGELSLPRHIPS